MNKQGFGKMNNGSCLSRAEMLDYLGGKLSHEEQHRVEIHLLDCELCNDANEGLEQWKAPSHLEAIDEHMHLEIDEMLEPDKASKIKVLFPWRMAAAIALIFISTLVLFLILPDNKEAELFTQEYKPYPAPAVSDNSDVEVSPAPIELKAGEAQEQVNSENIKSSARQQARAEPEEKEIQDNVQMSIEAPQDAIAEEAAPDNKDEDFREGNVSEKTTEEIPASTTVSALKEERSESKAVSSTRKSAAVPSATESIATDAAKIDLDFQLGIEAYRKQDYSTASRYLEKSNHPEAQFYLGVSQLSLDNPHIAIDKLSAYLKSGDKKLREAAWWYTGLSAIKAKDKKLAKKALKEVITFKGKFEKQATDLLRKL